MVDIAQLALQFFAVGGLLIMQEANSVVSARKLHYNMYKNQRNFRRLTLLLFHTETTQFT